MGAEFYIFLTKYASHHSLSVSIHVVLFLLIVLPLFPFSSEDVLSKDTGECAICLEDLQQGDTIARLPCLCIYHKG